MEPSNGIKVIVFDLEGVIFETWHTFMHFIPDMKTLDQSKLEEITEGEEMRAFFLGKIKEKQFIDDIIRISGITAPVEEIESAIRLAIAEKQGMRGIITQLKGAYRLALLTNFPKEWFDYLDARYGMRRLFDVIFVSGSTGIRKPDVEAYRQVTNFFKVLPSECLFIDDKKRNTDGARAFGMPCVLFTDVATLTKEFKTEWGICLR